MQRAKAFFYVCAGLFLLAVAYHLGATSATAQAPGNPVVALGPAPSGLPTAYYGSAVTANGDVYGATGQDLATWTHLGNIFSGPVSVGRTSWGELKARYLGQPGASSPAGQGR